MHAVEQPFGPVPGFKTVPAPLRSLLSGNSTLEINPLALAVRPFIPKRHPFGPFDQGPALSFHMADSEWRIRRLAKNRIRTVPRRLMGFEFFQSFCQTTALQNRAHR